MKALILRALARAAFRAVNRKSPKVELAVGTPLAAVVAGVLSIWLPPEASASIAGAVGAITTTVVNLLGGDDPPEGN